MRLALLPFVLLLGTFPIFANLTYSCDPNIDATQAGTCDALKDSTVAGEYNSIFNNINANIYITYSNIGAYGESLPVLTAVPYSVYYSALGLSTNDPTAYSSLIPTDPLTAYGNTDQSIDITPALASALGITYGGANTAGETPTGASCTLGNPNCYSGVVEISSQYTYEYPLSPSDSVSGLDFFTVVEHETDENLGTISCIATDSNSQPTEGCSNTGPDASPADLFRYQSAGVRSFLTTANGTPAYFSIDSGITDIADYNNSPNGGDYGDWLFDPNNVKVQDAALSYGTHDITTDGGSEIAVLNAVGFNTAPEPSTYSMLGASLALLWVMRHFRKASK